MFLDLTFKRKEDLRPAVRRIQRRQIRKSRRWVPCEPDYSAKLIASNAAGRAVSDVFSFTTAKGCWDTTAAEPTLAVLRAGGGSAG